MLFRKLTAAQRAELAARREQDPRRWTFEALAAHYGCSHMTAHRICRPEAVEYDRKYREKKRGERAASEAPGLAKVQRLRAQIEELRQSDPRRWTYAALADHYECSATTIYAVLNFDKSKN